VEKEEEYTYVKTREGGKNNSMMKKYECENGSIRILWIGLVTS